MYAHQSKLFHPDTVEDIKQRADIVNIISGDVTLKKRGKDYVGLCPFHKEKTPSFTVSPTKQLYHCFGCSVGGDAIKFLMELNRDSFYDVVLGLARDYGVRVRYEDGSFDDSPLPPPRPRLTPLLPEPRYLPASIPDSEISLAVLPPGEVETPIRLYQPHPALPETNAWVTRYLYSQDQWVDRIEWVDDTKSKGYDKIVLPYHVAQCGEAINAKGQRPWLPYRWSEVLASSEGKWVLGLEGETCVETARALGLAALTWQGGSWSQESINQSLSELKTAGIAGLFYFPDHDEAGHKKAEKVSLAARRAGLPCIILNPKEIWAEMPEKGDIVDWYGWARSQGIQSADMTAHLVTVARDTAIALRSSQEKERMNGGSGSSSGGGRSGGGAGGSGSGDGNEPPDRGSKILTHPAWTPLSPDELLCEINSLIDRGLPDSEITLTIPNLAKRAGYTESATWKIYHERLKEVEATENRAETAALVDLLLSARAASVPLHSVLPLLLAEPLAKYCGWLNIRPEVVLLTFLTTVSGLHHSATTCWLNHDWDFEVKPNLFTAIVAPPSQKKSPVLKTIAKKPLRVLERKARDEWKKAIADYRATEQYYNSLTKEQKEQEFPEGLPSPPPDRRQIHSFTDTTSEGLRNQIEAYPNQGLIALPDELARLIKSANKYRGGKGSDEEDLLSYYDGSGETVLRADGLAGDFDNLLLAVLGSIQPGVLQKMVKDCQDENGKWARFQFVVQPLAPSVMSADGGSFDLTPMLANLYERVNNLPPQDYKPEREAFAYYCSIYNEFERRRCNESHPGLSAAWGKAEGRIGKLACNLHVVHELMAGRTPSEFIPKARYEEAFAIAMFSMQQVFSLYNELGDENALATHLTKVLTLSQRKGSIAARDVQLLYDSKSRPTPDAVRSWFRELEAMNKGKTSGMGRNLSFTAFVEIVEQKVESHSTFSSYTNQGLQPNVENVEVSGVFPLKTSYPDLIQNTVVSEIKKSEIFSTTSTDSTIASSVEEMVVSGVETSSTENSTNVTQKAPDPDDDPSPPGVRQLFPRTSRYSYQGLLGLWVLQIQFLSPTEASVTYTSPAPENTIYTQSLVESSLIEVGSECTKWVAYLEEKIQHQRSSSENAVGLNSKSSPQFRYCGNQPASGLVEIKGRRSMVKSIQPCQIVVLSDEGQHSNPALVYVLPAEEKDWLGGVAVRVEDLQLLD
jgi:hypothetical protein